jgi:Domain of unknown function (DUF5047)
MRPVSDTFLRTVAGSHSMSARARVCQTFQTGTDPDGTTIPILAGDVFADANANIRSTLDLTTDGTAMWPSRTNLLLAPYGHEIFVERGVQFGGGTTEWVSLGYYRIQTPDQANAPDGPIRIQARDRMAGLVDGRLLAPVQFLAAATYGAVMTQLVTEVYPAATIQWPDGGDSTAIGRDLIAEEDRYGFLNDLVKSLGKIWHWDHRGILVIRDQPSTATPVFDVNHGESGVLLKLARQLTRERVYNAVVATGEAADTETPVRAVAIDNNPSSPTYFHGPFGPVPQFFSSPFLTSNSQAGTAAESMLRKQLGLPYNADFTAVPNPALEPWDPIRVRYSERYGVETHIIETLQIPLVAQAPMTGTTREQTVVLVGVS